MHYPNSDLCPPINRFKTCSCVSDAPISLLRRHISGFASLHIAAVGSPRSAAVRMPTCLN